MRRIATLTLVAVLTVALATNAKALDTVKTADDTISGTIKSVSALKVVVERGSTAREIAAGDVESISYDGEPSVLKTARIAAAAGRYEDALESLAELNLGRNRTTRDCPRHPILPGLQCCSDGTRGERRYWRSRKQGFCFRQREQG